MLIVLGAETALLERRLAQDRPTFAICRGSQLMAQTLGARVFPARSRRSAGVGDAYRGWTGIAAKRSCRRRGSAQTERPRNMG
jgi:GMP synthase-like glutamine amidotransferase